MNEKLYSIIKKNEEKGDFTHAIITNDMLKEVEEKLDLQLPVQYICFLENCGEWLYCINANDGKIVI